MMRAARLASLIAATLLTAAPAHAQTASPSPSPQPQVTRTVYYLDFDQQGDGFDTEIDNFAEKLLILRLGQLKSYKMVKKERGDAPKCDTAGPAAPGDPQTVTIGSDARHYLFKAVINLREPAAGAREAVLDYELLKCRQDGTSLSLGADTQTFPYDEVLRYLNAMADTVSSLLEQEKKVTKVAVDFKGITSDLKDAPAHGPALSERLLAALNEAQEFEPRDLRAAPPPGQPADYSISGRVSDQQGKLWFEVEVRRRRGGGPSKKFLLGPALSAPTDPQKLEEFYNEAALLAVDQLALVRNMADTEQPSPNQNEAEMYLRQAERLLCKEESQKTGCAPQPSPAADLLTEVVRNKKYNTSVVWELRGSAHAQAGDYKSAAESFEQAARLAPQENRGVAVPDLLSQAGAAWLEARDYTQSLRVYDDLKKQSPDSAVADLGRAKSYRYNNERLKALGVLLGIKSLSDVTALRQELELVMGTLLPEEVAPAKNILDASAGQASAEVARPLLNKRQAELGNTGAGSD